MPESQRLDVLLVTKGLVESREKAQRLILAGQIEAKGFKNLKPGMKLPVDTILLVRKPEKYVSRGGLKLEAALASFAIDVSHLVCADVGTSTGGFTDCLLQHGAARVYAIDVGRSQIHERLRSDPRVILVEHTNARQLQSSSVPEQVDLIAIDVSFISLSLVLPALRNIAKPDGVLVALFKPQFESTRQEASRARGVISDPAIHVRILSNFVEQAPQLGWTPRAVCASPVAGGSGNREYLFMLSPNEEGNPGPSRPFDIDALVALTFIKKD